VHLSVPAPRENLEAKRTVNADFGWLDNQLTLTDCQIATADPHGLVSRDKLNLCCHGIQRRVSLSPLAFLILQSGVSLAVNGGKL